MAAQRPRRRNRSAVSRRAAGPPLARRPAARRGASRVNWDRVGRIALTLVLAAVLYSYLNPAIDFVKTYTATTAAKAKLHEAQHENTSACTGGSSTPTTRSCSTRKARAQGMVAPGETPVVIRGLSG